MPNPNTARIADIDQQIVYLHAHIAFLKTERNTMVPIFSLPDDLLRKIFMQHAMDDGQGTIFDLKWISIMYVCRRWSVVARHHQALWSYISAAVNFHRGTDVTRILTQFARSGSSPLTIKLKSFDHDPGSARYAAQTAAYMLQAFTDRIVSLEVYSGCTAPFAAAMIEYIGDWDMPVLTSFDFRSLAVPGMPPFPATILNQNAPRITSLTLGHCLFDWNSPRNLQDFAVEYDRALVDLPPPTHAALMSALERSPSLRTLRLQYCLPEDTGVAQSPNLPLLESLTLFDDVDKCTHFLLSVGFPATTSLTLYASGVSHPPDIRKLLIPCHKHFSRSGALAVRQVIWSSFDTNLHLQFLTTDASVASSFDSESSPDLYFALNLHPHTEADRRKLFVKVLKAVPLSCTTHLDARAVASVSVRTGKAVLSLLPAVETLSLSNNVAAVNICHSLLQRLDDSTQSKKKKSASVPPLRHISLRFIPFYCNRDLDEAGLDAAEASFTARSVEVLHTVASVLEMYRKSGHPLHSLRFTSTRETTKVLEDAMTDRLLDAVSMIYWEDTKHKDTKESMATARMQMIQMRKQRELQVEASGV